MCVRERERERERARSDATYSLNSIDDEQYSIGESERSRDLIGEVDMAGSVHQVEEITLADAILQNQRHGRRLDADQAILLELERVGVSNLHRATPKCWCATLICMNSNDVRSCSDSISCRVSVVRACRRGWSCRRGGCPRPRCCESSLDDQRVPPRIYKRSTPRERERERERRACGC